MAANWDSVEAAVWAWVVAGSGLSESTVIRADQDGPRPEPNFASIRLGRSMSPAGVVDQVSQEYDSGADPGEEITLTASGPREFEVEVEVFTASAVGSDSAFARASRVQTALGLPGVRDALHAAGLTPFDNGKVRVIPDVLDTKWEGRALLVARFYVEESASETTGYIDATEITPTYDEEEQAPFIVGTPVPYADLELLQQGSDADDDVAYQVGDPLTFEAGRLYLLAFVHRALGTGAPATPTVDVVTMGAGVFGEVDSTAFGEDDVDEGLGQFAVRLFYLMVDEDLPAPGGLFFDFGAETQVALTWQLFVADGVVEGNGGQDAWTANLTSTIDDAETLELDLGDQAFNRSAFFAYGMSTPAAAFDPAGEFEDLGSQGDTESATVGCFWNPFPYYDGEGSADFNECDAGAVGLVLVPA